MNDNSFNIMTPDIILECESWNEIDGLEEMVNEATSALVAHLELDKFFNNADFSVLLTNDQRIKSLNKEYRGKDKVTDVLSFPVEELSYLEPEKMKALNNSSIGDIVISFETLKKEAFEQNKNFNDHFKHLLIHSMLHLLGFDHENTEEAKNMESVEINILARINIKSPYE
jgi:probable rRNA maturation factor